MTEHVEDAEIVGTEIEPYRRHEPANLFGVDEPERVIERASSIATALAAVVKKQGLVKEIQNRPHPLVEAWTLLGSMLGVFPVIVWTRPLEREGRVFGFEARCEARTRDGQIVGSAEAQCDRSENMWSWDPRGKNGQKLRPRDDHALRAMAQTRARSKALAGPLGFVMVLAGYEATPAEDMPPDDPAAPADRARPAKLISKEQHAKIGAMLRELNEKRPPPEGVKPWVAEVRALVGKSSRKDFTSAEASQAIEYLQQQLDAAEIPFG